MSASPSASLDRVSAASATAPSGVLISGNSLGVLHQGERVTAHLATPLGFRLQTIQWFADDKLIISGQGDTLVDLNASYVGKQLSVIVTGTDYRGLPLLYTSNSVPVLAISTTPIVDMGSGKIVGTLAAGQTLHYDLGSSITDAIYQWQASDDGTVWTNLAGATAASITLGATAPGVLRVLVNYAGAPGGYAAPVATLYGDHADTLMATGGTTDTGAGNDVIYANYYPTFYGYGAIDGGAGLDTLVTRAYSTYSLPIRAGADSWSVDGATLTNVERIQYGDGLAVALDADGVAGQAYRLYQAAFDRKPDAIGIGFWIGQLDAGASVALVGEAFVKSPEFAALYGSNPSNTALVGKLYQNVLHRAPDAAGVQFWVDLLDRHVASVAEVLVQFSDSPENVAALAGVLGAGVLYRPTAALPAAQWLTVSPPYGTAVPVLGIVHLDTAYLGSGELGLAFEGATLVATTAFSRTPQSLSYQWFADGQLMQTTATGSLALTSAYAGKTVSVSVSGIDDNGATVSFTSTGMPVIHVNPAPAGHVDQAATLTIAGTVAAGQTLQAVVTDADGVDAAYFQWQVSYDGVTWAKVAGATGSTFALGASAPAAVRVLGTYSDVLGGVGAGLTTLGTEGADVFKASYDASILYAAGGDDTIYLTGFGVIDGGAGLDTVIAPSYRYFYNIGGNSNDAGMSGLVGPGYSFHHVERLQFYDMNIALDGDGVAGQAYRLYQAAFDRVPDMVGIGFWIKRMDKGDSATLVADAFVHSTEFTALYGSNPSNTALVDRFYQNILHRAPDAVGEHFWVDLLDRHVATVAEVLVQFSDSPENVAALVGVIDKGIAYIPYVA